MIWTPATPPQAAPVRGEMIEVADAFVTPFERGDLDSAEPPHSWIRGAVHRADGRLVRASQRAWAGDPRSPVPDDPEIVTVTPTGKRLTGRWIYAGHFTRHFGHFLLEALTNLWPDPAEAAVSGILFHRSAWANPPRPKAGIHFPELTGWHRELLELSGYGGLRVRVIQARPAHVETLLVPTRPVALKAWTGPEAVVVWRRIAERVGSPGEAARIFFSRTRFHGEAAGWHVRSSEDWDRLMDDRFAAAEFRVVHPELLGIAEQVRLAKGAEVLAGASGSALHLSVFADPGTRVLEIGDAGSPSVPQPSQRMIDAACGHLSAFVPQGDELRLAAVLSAL